MIRQRGKVGGGFRRKEEAKFYMVEGKLGGLFFICEGIMKLMRRKG